MFTGLFSFGAPANPETLRDWLSDVIELRESLASRRAAPRITKIRDALLGSESVDVRDENELLEVLRNDNLPDVVASDQGALARKGMGSGDATFYTFLGGTDETPSIMVLIDQFVEQLVATATPNVRAAMTAVRAHFWIDSTSSKDLGDLELPEPASVAPVAS